jgi:hypothetical protein
MSHDDKYEDLARKLMSDSKMDLSDPGFDEMVLGQIMLEFNKNKKRKTIISSVLLFIGIEFTLLAILLLMILYFPGSNNLTNLINSVLQYLSKIGEFVMKYDYLIVSFLFVGLLDRVMNLKTRSRKIYL